MKQIQFMEEPGFLYDLLALFTLNYNREIWKTKFAIPEDLERDLNRNERILSEFTTFPPELILFFYTKDENVSFLSNYYFMNDSKHQYDLGQFLNALSGETEMIANTLQYYFCNEKKVPRCDKPHFIQQVTRLIQAYDYPDEVNLHLLSFYLEPSHYIGILKKALKDKAVELRRFYQRHRACLKKAQRNFTLEKMRQIDEMTLPRLEGYYDSKFVVSFTLIPRYLVMSTRQNIRFFGIDFEKNITGFLNRKNTFDFTVFGIAVKDSCRVEILELLRQHGQFSQADFMEIMKVSREFLFFHLTLLSNGCLIIAETSNRGILYRINEEWICFVSSVFYTYIEQEQQKELLP